MSKSFTKYPWIAALLIIIIFVRYNQGYVQQDDYVGYARSFENNLNDLSHFNSRLFPGFPILIFIINILFSNYVVTGYILVLFFLFASLILLEKTVKSQNDFLLMLFPPVMLDMSTKIASEYICVFLVLLTVYFYKNKKYSFASFTAGMNYWIRPVGSIMFIAMILALLFNKENLKLKYFLYFLIPIAALILYNSYFFHSATPFYQFLTYKEVSPYGNAVGFIQIVRDIFRTLQWKQYRIFLSGIFYIILFLYSAFKIYKKYNKSLSGYSVFVISSIILMTTYTLSYSFSPFLENLGRYLVPMIILIWILMHNEIVLTNRLLKVLLIFVSVVVVLF